MLRNVRSDIKQEIENQEGSSGVSEDDIARDLEELERRHKVFLDDLEKLSEHKEKELMTV